MSTLIREGKVNRILSTAVPPQLRIHHDVPCLGCGILCDDLQVEVDTTTAGVPTIRTVTPPCPLAERLFLDPPPQAENMGLIDTGLIDMGLIDGKPAPWEDCCRRAAEILAAARAPAMIGLEQTTCEAQRQAIAIADLVGATLDPTSVACQSTNYVARQTIGAISATLPLVFFNGSLTNFHCQCASLHYFSPHSTIKS